MRAFKLEVAVATLGGVAASALARGLPLAERALAERPAADLRAGHAGPDSRRNRAACPGVGGDRRRAVDRAVAATRPSGSPSFGIGIRHQLAQGVEPPASGHAEAWFPGASRARRRSLSGGRRGGAFNPLVLMEAALTAAPGPARSAPAGASCREARRPSTPRPRRRRVLLYRAGSPGARHRECERENTAGAGGRRPVALARRPRALASRGASGPAAPRCRGPRAAMCAWSPRSRNLHG